MFVFLKNCIRISLIIVFVSVGNVQAEDKNNILAKGDFFSVTQEDIILLRERMKSFFETTEKEYCRALLKITLLSREARDLKIDMEPAVAAELQQLVEQKLFEIYVNRLLDDYELLPETVDSYYDSHPEEFTMEDGSLLPLDARLRKAIRKKIMEAKRSDIVSREMDRLMKKHNVEIISPVCDGKEASDE